MSASFKLVILVWEANFNLHGLFKKCVSKLYLNYCWFSVVKRIFHLFELFNPLRNIFLRSDFRWVIFLITWDNFMIRIYWHAPHLHRDHHKPQIYKHQSLLWSFLKKLDLNSSFKHQKCLFLFLFAIPKWFLYLGLRKILCVKIFMCYPNSEYNEYYLNDNFVYNRLIISFYVLVLLIVFIYTSLVCVYSMEVISFFLVSSSSFYL